MGALGEVEEDLPGVALQHVHPGGPLEPSGDHAGHGVLDETAGGVAQVLHQQRARGAGARPGRTRHVGGGDDVDHVEPALLELALLGGPAQRAVGVG